MSLAVPERLDERAERLAAAPRAVAVEGISKSFTLPHQRYSTLKERVLAIGKPRTHDKLRVLDEMSFDVARGEFFGIVGRNGSGKSTLLKCLAGIYGLNEGRIFMSGRPSTFIELGVGFNPELSARDNVRINGTLLGLGKRELDERFDGIFEFAGLGRFVDQKLKNFSSGMQVRLAYAIAIQVDFDILLLDEVLAVGDEGFQQKCFDTFARFREEGKTIVLVTHALDLIERFADRALLLREGHVQAVGAPSDVIAQYHEELASQAEASNISVVEAAS